MKLFGIQLSDNQKKVNFNGTRTLKNTVSQLARNNKYSLIEPNQRYITNSIAELGKVAGEKNIKFLLNVAAKTKYSTNIKLTDSPKNDWVTMLLNAASAALSITPLVNRTKFAKQIQELSKPKALSDDEKEILSERDKLISSVDMEQIKNETVGGIKDFQRNLDYFIVSSETTVAHKKYVLKRLNYFMSDKYKINPQLEDKKSIAVAEMVNDMAIFTPGHKIPNIKAVNQKQHGMCAAISIVRKKLAYEDKPNYVDSIISELDASEFMRVYDRSKLGTGKRTLFRKIPVDFEAALAKGYRIIDASTTQWMHLSSMSGYSGVTFENYNPFDRDNFDVNADSFFNAKFEDPELSVLQEYYQALLKAGELLDDYKADTIKNKVQNRDERLNANNKVKTLKDISDAIAEKTGSSRIANGILKLNHKYSDQINEGEEFAYIQNEEDVAKKNKIRNYILSVKPDADVSRENIDAIYDLTEFYHSVAESGRRSRSKNDGINRAKSLYNIAASNRFQFIKGLEDETTLKRIMIDENVPHREELLIQTIDMYISKIKENSADAEDIIIGMGVNMGGILDKPTALKVLRQIKQEVNKATSTEFDNFFKAIGLKSQKHAFSAFLNATIASIEQGNPDTLVYAADRLGVPEDAEEVISILKNMRKQVNRGNRSQFNEAFNLMGNTSRLQFLCSLYEDFINKLQSEDNEQVVNDFIKINNLDLLKNPNAIQEKVSELEEILLSLQYLLNTYSSILTITDFDDNVLHSPIPTYVILKKLENNGTVTSTKDLKELQNHFERIQQDRSSDEFNSRQGKLKDKSLYKFSKTEQMALDVIEHNINQINRYVQKQLTHIESYIKYPLEELKRMVGLEMGHWWVRKEGESGLFRGQQIRILEYITGRPHHTTKNLKKAIETIKTSPYSGISSSSVFHDKPGYHAQYIADVAPVEINVVKPDGKSEKQTVDVLFQDNTWGASEHENTWVDSNGLVRTDYSDNRGGTLGYITNEMYRNGNFVHRVLGDMVLEEEPVVVENRVYKKIRKADDEAYRAPQYSEIILDGKSKEAKDIAKSIHDSVFVPTVTQISKMKLFTRGLSEAELKTKIKALKYTAANWEEKYDELMKRIQSNDSSIAIRTKEDYDKLSDKDPLKVKLEKAALKKNYKIRDLDSEIARVNDIKDLEEFREIQKERAIEDLKYSFGKDVNVVAYLADSVDAGDLAKIDKILQKYGIKLTDEQYEAMLDTYEINESDFNGSMKQTLRKLMENLTKNIKKVVKNSDAQTEVVNFMRRLLAKKMYFTTSDIKEEKVENLIKFIDRVYNPDDNAALARIFRKLQDMTTEEFDKEVLPKITDEELGIKQHTGYELLKQIQRYESGAVSKLRNAVWADELYLTTEPAEEHVEYEPHKLYRRARTLQSYNFDTSYREMKNDLDWLNLGKLFDKYKARNLDRYGVYPAYPKIEYMPETMFRYGFESCIDEIPKHISQIKAARDLIDYYKFSDTLKEYSAVIEPSYVLNEEQYYALNEILGQISTQIYNDESQVEVFEAATEAMEIEQGSEFGAYKDYIDKITSKIDSYRVSCSTENLESQIKVEKTIVSRLSDMFIKSFIRSRYQDHVFKTLQNYKAALIRGSKTKDGESLADIYKEQLWQELHKYHILQEPEEALEKYVLSLAKDSPLHDYQSSFEILLHRALGFAQLHEVQSTLMDALSDGIETDVKAAFDSINIEAMDGTIMPMSSGDIIYSMVQSLILDYQEETALLFLDKFGLNEQFVEYTAKNYDFEELKQLIDDAVETRKNYSAFGEVYRKSLESAYSDLQNGAKINKVANRMRQELYKAAKQYKLNKEDAKEFLKSLSEIKRSCAKNPNVAPIEMFNTILTKSVGELENSVQSDMENINSALSSCETIASVVNKVNILEKSPINALREEFNAKFSEIVEYQNKLYENLQEEEESAKI